MGVEDFAESVACWIGTVGIGPMEREDEPPEEQLVRGCHGFRAGGGDRGGGGGGGAVFE